MAFIGVPWAVEGGASNPITGARILAYAATNGNGGVMGFGDLRVTQQDVPGPNVQVSTGTVVIVNRAVGYDYQSYIASRPVADDVVPIAPNTGAATRYDLIVARVENPWLTSESWPTPTSVADGPYAGARVIQGVTQAQATIKSVARKYLKSLNMSAEPLAGLSLPASGSNVQNAYLTDLRTIANPRRYRPGILTYLPASRINVPGSMSNWLAPASWTVDIPDWATRITLVSTIGGAKVDRQSSSTDGHTNGELRFRLGTDGDAVVTQTIKYDLDAPNNSGATRTTIALGDSIAVPANYRGTTQQLAVQGDQLAGNQPLYVDGSAFAMVDVEFVETPT